VGERRRQAIRRVLVIRLGALGDIVQSFGPFAAIRAHHPAAHITLLTTAPYAEWLGAASWFDAVEVDARPRWRQVAGLVRLAGQLRGFDLVYDLQTSGRSGWYFWLAGCPPWSGIGPFRRFPHRDPARDLLHTHERQRGQLRDAGILDVPRPDLTRLLAWPGTVFATRYALLVPGASPERPEKRWPAERFAALAEALVARGLTPVVAGTVADRPAAMVIRARCPAAFDMTGQTTLAQLGALAAGAALAVGNDTGPMHLAAAFGTRCIVLFGGGSDPALTAPRRPDGGFATVLRTQNLADLPVDQVVAALGC
jgi:ADP-heptose:LPS heptosyltransferase